MGNRFRRKLISFILIFSMLFTILPMSALAAETEGLRIKAAGMDKLTVEQGSAEVPEEGDGIIALSALEQTIERDYEQKVTVQVKNLADVPMQYYLECNNMNEKIYMNFVESGSRDMPLTILPGETQDVVLNVFAQNATETWYLVPIKAYGADGTLLTEYDLQFSCAAPTGNIHYEQMQVNESTLATTYQIKNAGNADILDLTLGMTGEAADYVRIVPGVENYPLAVNGSVEVQLIPDLAKMKDKGKSVVKGMLQASGGANDGVEVSFDTKGQKIQSTTMSALALKQSGNPYYDLKVEPETIGGTFRDKDIHSLAEKYMGNGGDGITTTAEANEVYKELFDENGMMDFSVKTGYTYSGKEKQVGANLRVSSKLVSGFVSEKPVTEVGYNQSTGRYDCNTTIYVTGAEYNKLISNFQSDVEDKLNLSENTTIGKPGADQKIAVSFGYSMFGASDLKSVSDFNDVIGTTKDVYNSMNVMLSPEYSEDEKKGYVAINSSRIFMRHVAGPVIMGVMTTTMDGFGVIVGALCNAIIDWSLDDLAAGYEKYILGMDGGAIYYDIYGNQCTNVGSVTSDFYLPDYGAKPSGMYETGRMYNGEADAGFAQLNSVNYSYTVNGVATGSSHNNGLAQVTIANLMPFVTQLKPGLNTIVRDYDTNPGNYRVVADTEITVLYPEDAKVSYIGNPEELQDVRLRPDFAIYPENITLARPAVIGEENKVTVYFYNRGSLGGWVDLTVQDGTQIVYKSEKPVFMEAFSEQSVTFDWNPTTSTTFKATLTNRSEGLDNIKGIDERKDTNNSAERCINARERQVPIIQTIGPATAAQNEIMYVTADVANPADMKEVAVAIDGVNCDLNDITIAETSENTIRVATKVKALAVGTHKIKVTITYATGVQTTATVEKNAEISISARASNSFVVDSTVINPTFKVVDPKGKLIPTTVSKTDSGYTLNQTAAMTEAQGEGYILMTSCENGLIVTPVSELTGTLSLTNGKTISIENHGEVLKSVAVNYIDNNSVPKTILPLSEDSRSFKIVGAEQCDFQIYYTVKNMSVNSSINNWSVSSTSAINLSDYYQLYQMNLIEGPAHDTYCDARLFVTTADGQRSQWMNAMYDAASKTVTILEDSEYVIELIKKATDLQLYLACEDTLYQVDLTNYTTPVQLDRTNHSKISYQCPEAKVLSIDNTSLKIGVPSMDVNLYGNVLYVPAGTYSLAVAYVADGQKQSYHEQVNASQDVTVNLPNQKNGTTVSFRWPDIFDFGYMTYLLDLESDFSSNGFQVEQDEKIVVPAETQKISLYLSSYDSVSGAECSMDVSIDCNIVENQNNVLTVGDNFTGNMYCRSDTAYTNGTCELYFDTLKDSNGTELDYYNANSGEGTLYGYVILTNTSDNAEYKIPVATTYVGSSLDFMIPASVKEGTYTYRVELSTKKTEELPDDTKYDITATAEEGGSITPVGMVQVNEGADQTFQIQADADYSIRDVIVDGVSQGNISSYTFTNVRAGHTIVAQFQADETEPPKPSGGFGSGGFSGTYNYPVKVDGTVDGATVTFSKTNAVAGDKVVITVTPEAGKQVEEVIVTNSNDKRIEVTKVADNQYSFIMPEGSVKVDVVTKAATYDKRIVLQIDNRNVLVNDATINGDVTPVIVDGRTMVPIRVITESLGGKADWNEATRTVTLTIDGKVLSMTIDTTIPGFDAAPVILNNRTYVPIRYIAEALGAQVEWIADSRQIVITK